MGTVHVKTTNDKLLNITYDRETIKTLLSGWANLYLLSKKGDTVASAIMCDLVSAIGFDPLRLSELRDGLDPGIRKGGCLTDNQFICICYVMIVGYKQDEVAYVLGCTKQTVNIHIMRGIDRIVTFLGDDIPKPDKKRRKYGKKNKKKR